MYPEFRDKAVTIENILSTDLLEIQAKELITDMPRNGHEKYYFLLVVIQKQKF